MYVRYAKPTESHYLLRFEKGEELISLLTSFCKEKHITNGKINGLGSIEKPTLAHYRVDTKKYSEKQFDDIYEVTNLTGTIGLVENDPLPHIHVTLSDESMQALGGHLVTGIVSATLEVTITIFPTKFTKQYSEEIGLKLFELPEELHQ